MVALHVPGKIPGVEHQFCVIYNKMGIVGRMVGEDKHCVRFLQGVLIRFDRIILFPARFEGRDKGVVIGKLSS